LDKDYCRYGHPLTGENAYPKKGRNKPGCRICRSNEGKRYRTGTTKAPTHRWYGDYCTKGHMLTTETAGERMTSAGVRLWCRLCTREHYEQRKASRQTTPSRKMGDLCAAGLHLLTPETARIYRTKTTPVCLPCKRARDKQYKLDNPEKVANRTSEKRHGKHRAQGEPGQRPRERPTRESMPGAHTRRRQDRRILQVALEDERLLGDELSKADDERPSAVWNTLRPTGKALQALTLLYSEQDRVLDEGGTWNCRDNPAPWMDSWLDEVEEGVSKPAPAPNRVRSMCADCPLFVACQNYGIVSRDPGIWGGLRVGTDGKIYE
jgi:hypothetical protein